MFDNIRPLYDNELHDAIKQIVAAPIFPAIANFIYPDKTPEEVAELLLSIKDIYTLQNVVMRSAIEQILSRSVSKFTFQQNGIEPGKPYLFISNHRDIVLDAFLLQYHYIDFNNLFITFGANLMQDSIITLIGRANRMFRVERGGHPREFYQNMMLTSRYIRHVITTQHNSIWIAQRNGRTKNGLDETEPAILKMFALSDHSTKETPLRSLHSLNIVPISISYEWEPCDLLKAHELHLRHLGPYNKAPNEDMNSVITGLLQQKGHVNITVTKPLTDEEINLCAATSTPFENLAALIDHRIYSSFYLHPNNYIAHDILYNSNRHQNQYSSQQYEAFISHINQAPTQQERDILLQIYSNPTEHYRQTSHM